MLSNGTHKTCEAAKLPFRLQQCFLGQRQHFHKSHTMSNTWGNPCMSRRIERATHISAAVAAPAVLGPPPAGLLRRGGAPAGAAKLALLHAAVVPFLPAAAPRPIALAVAAVAAPQADAPVGRRALAAIAAASGSPGCQRTEREKESNGHKGRARHGNVVNLHEQASRLGF